MVGNYPAGVTDDDFHDRSDGDDPPRCYKCDAELTIGEGTLCSRCLRQEDGRDIFSAGFTAPELNKLRAERDALKLREAVASIQRRVDGWRLVARSPVAMAPVVHPAITSLDGGQQPQRYDGPCPGFTYDELRRPNADHAIDAMRYAADAIHDTRRAIELDIFKLKKPEPDQAQPKYNVVVRPNPHVCGWENVGTRIAHVQGTTLEMMLARRVVVLMDDQSEPP